MKFANEEKIRKQMAKRGWTEEQIREALAIEGIPVRGRSGPATRYVHPRTGWAGRSSWMTPRGRSSMSAGMGSGTDAAGRGRAETVHVALLDEGLDVWRPVAARRLSGDMFLILGQDHDREVETWAFGPGTVVRCRRETRGGEPILVASEAVREATAT